jgi:hypothetical protein
MASRASESKNTNFMFITERKKKKQLWARSRK